MSPEAFTWWSNLVIFLGLIGFVIYMIVDQFLFKRFLKEKYGKCSVCKGTGRISFNGTIEASGPCVICKGSGKLDMEED